METSPSQTKLSRAGELAKSGDYEAALVLLLQMEPTAASLDLRARIELQRGRYSDARELWNEVLELAPNHEGAKRGLRGVQHAAVRGKLLAPAALVLAVLGVGFVTVRSLRATPAEPQAGHVQLAAAQPKPLAQAVPAVRAPAAPARATAAPALPEIALPEGIHMRREAGAQIYSFEGGLFSSGVTFVGGGRDHVTALGRALAPYNDAIHIELIGYVDTLPVPLEKQYRTNSDLALARAYAVLYRLSRTTSIPDDQVGLRAIATRLGPFSDIQGDPRNRTVDVRVSLR